MRICNDLMIIKCYLGESIDILVCMLCIIITALSCSNSCSHKQCATKGELRNYGTIINQIKERRKNKLNAYNDYKRFTLFDDTTKRYYIDDDK